MTPISANGPHSTAWERLAGRPWLGIVAGLVVVTSLAALFTPGAWHARLLAVMYGLSACVQGGVGSDIWR